MEAARSSEMFPIYQTAWCYVLEDHIFMFNADRTSNKEAISVKLTRCLPLKAQGFPRLI